jgi:hypothetical protein
VPYVRPTAEGRLHLACWLDLDTREVVGHAMADHRRAWPDRATARAEVFSFIQPTPEHHPALHVRPP